MILITTEEIAVYVKKEIIRELFTNVKGFNHCGVIDLWISGKTLDRYISKVSQYFLNETKEQLAEVYNNGLKNGHTLFIRKSEYEKILNNYLSEKYNVEQKCLEMVSFKNSSLKQKKEIQLDYISKLEWTKTIKAEYMLYDAIDKEKNTYKVYNDTGTKRKYPFKYNKMKEIKDMESRERMEQMMEDQYNRGITVGMELMMEKLRMAADNGTPIEIDGRAWYLKSDIENLRDIFEDMENADH